MNADILLSQRFVEKHADDAARALVSIDFSARLAFLNSLPPVHIGALLRRLDGSLAAQILGDIETERAVRALESLPSETSATLLRRLEAPEQKTFVARVRASDPEPLEQLLHYPENSAGALMNPRVFTLSPHLEAHAALAHVRAHSGQAIYYIYIVGEDQRLLGVVNLRELMAAEQGERIEQIMTSDLARIGAQASLQAVIAHPGWLDFPALPVIDDAGRLVGVLRYKNLRRLQNGDYNPAADGLDSTGAALGELFRIGMDALVKSTAHRTE
jgi:magnesium transporter